jgi:hypothetical protein
MSGIVPGSVFSVFRNGAHASFACSPHAQGGGTMVKDQYENPQRKDDGRTRDRSSDIADPLKPDRPHYTRPMPGPEDHPEKRDKPNKDYAVPKEDYSEKRNA